MISVRMLVLLVALAAIPHQAQAGATACNTKAPGGCPDAVEQRSRRTRAPIKLPLRRKSDLLLPLLGGEQSPLPAGDNVTIRSLFGNWGEYYVTLTIGGQELRVDIDTGSADLGVIGTECPSCNLPKRKRAYNASGSATSRAVSCADPKRDNVTEGCTPCHTRRDGEKVCGFGISYEDGSGFSASLFVDDVAFGAPPATPVVPAAVGSIYHLGLPSEWTLLVDGIIGLAYSSVAVTDTGAPTAYEQLVNAGAIDDVFSMCFDRASGGVLTIGGDGGHVPAGALQWSPLLKESFYVVSMTDFRVDGVSAGAPAGVYNRGECIVDSGSSSISLPRPAFDAFRATLYARCAHAATADLVGICRDAQGRKLRPTEKSMFQGHCFPLTAADVAKFPNFQVVLDDGAGGDVVLELTPAHYLRSGWIYCSGKDHYTLGIDSESVADGTLLGDVFMEGFVNVFDRARRRLGFARVGGDGCQLLDA